MDALMLSRLQFAGATFFHFMFVPLTLGLSVLVAIMETRYLRTGDETYKRMTKFWGKLFVINFALGVVTGITLEFQFGTNWSRYSAYVGDIFGSLLAIEATLAFFLESTFIGVWIFGWDKVSPKVHATAIWIVAVASNLSALWILLANGWMQHPVGYVLRNGRAELDDFLAVLANSFGWMEYLHTVAGSWMLSGFFVMGVSAYHLLKKTDDDFFGRSFRMGATFALVFSIVTVGQGHFHGNEVASVQPAKLAAMESHWHTQKSAPMHLFSIPDEENERNSVDLLAIPGMLSLLAASDPGAEVKGLLEFAEEDRPPVAITYWSFRVMVGLGLLFLLLAILGWRFRNDPGGSPGSLRYLRILPYVIPLPYFALWAGWTVAEVGRQPWIVHGLMRTSDAVSPALTASQVWFSLSVMTALYLLLGAMDIYLLFKYARRGPVPHPAAS